MKAVQDHRKTINIPRKARKQKWFPLINERLRFIVSFMHETFHVAIGRLDWLPVVTKHDSLFCHAAVTWSSELDSRFWSDSFIVAVLVFVCFLVL